MTGVVLTLVGALAAVAAPVAPAAEVGAQVTTVPRPDHVVVLVLENHSSSTILGNPAAPYINSLASSGANMTQSFALTHPSQPNYIALFSGSTNGVTDDSCPHTFATDNLGAQLGAANLDFVGYSEDQPSAGYTGCFSGKYARKHNPWVNFTTVPTAANQPLTSFPTDYSTLPAVSFVIPSLVNDMHDGSIAQGDSWVRDHLDGYVQWAKEHNSVFVLTFDEDDNASGNQIATVIVGQRVQPGQYPERITHYTVLRTIEDAFGLPPLGGSAGAQPLLSIWSPDPGAPQPALTLRCADLGCTADGSGSTAPGGTVRDWRWDWGDGTVTTDATSSQHTYGVAGDYPVTLRITDSQGASAQTTRTASVRAPGDGDVFAADGFSRAVSGGWGAAEVGGGWSVSGSASGYSVSSGSGSLLMQKAGETRSVVLPGVSSSDTDLRLGVAASALPSGNGLYVTVVGRRVAANAEYQGRARVRGDGSVAVSVLVLPGSAAATTLRSEVVASGVRVSPGSVLNTRLQVTGTSPTTVRWKVWTGASEPAGWQQTVSDSTAVVQGKGSVGVGAYLSGSSTVAPVTARVSNLTARPTVPAPVVNQPPSAAFTSSSADLAASFDASGSADADGTVAAYAWDFGDASAAGSGAKPVHSYASAGTYPVRLTVTDDRGATATVGHDVTVTAPVVNQPPSAAFTSSSADLAASFDASGSADADGTVAAYAWDFGDASAAGSGAKPVHSYAVAGTYPVRLTVTDDRGATATVGHDVTVTAPAVNQPPSAAFTSSSADLAASFDASASADADGTVAAYAWDFGDASAAGSGAKPVHSYAAAGTYPVRLTVTDDRGATATVGHDVTVTAPAAPTVFAADGFSRAVSGGWGAAEVGGGWSVSGSASGYSVSSGSGSLLMQKAGETRSVVLPGVSSSDTDLRLGVAASALPSGNGLYVTVVGRRVAANAEYQGRARVRGDGSVAVSVLVLPGSAAATTLRSEVVASGVRVSPGSVLNTRLQVTGTSPTTVRWKVWTGASEPAGWQQTVSDSTAVVQGKGSVGVGAYLSGSSTVAPVTARVSNLTARPTAG